MIGAKAVVIINLIFLIYFPNILVHCACTLSKTTMIESVSSRIREEDLTFNWRPGDTTCQWKIKGSPSCPIGIKCFLRLPDNGVCSKSVYITVKDGKGGNVACGEGTFQARTSDNNLHDMYLNIANVNRISNNASVYVKCFAECDVYNEFTPLLARKKKNNKLTYHLTQEVTTTSGPVSFIWPANPNSQEQLIFWTVFAEHQCKVVMKCSIYHYGNCAQTGAYVEVSDGVSGEKQYCGNVAFEASPSDTKLRDMYLKIHAPNNPRVLKVSCTAKCGSGANTALPKEMERKMDLRCVCGLHNMDNRIIGGEDATKNEFPWQVALVIAKSRVSFCGGTVINDKFILTAKHCFLNKNVGLDGLGKFEVLIRAHELSQMLPDNITNFNQLWSKPIHPDILAQDAAENTLRLKVVEIIVPDLFLRFNDDYDIVLLRLERKLDLSSADGITPICLPSVDDHDTYQNMLVGKMLTALGWGLTDTQKSSTVLKKVDVPYLPDAQCVQPVKQIGGTLTPRMMCAYFSNDVINNTCKGDSGGPLMFQQPNKQYFQVGITSFGGSCFQANKPSVYTKVSEMTQWIQYFSNEWGAKWCMVESL